MKTRLLKKFRKEAERRVTIKYLERDGVMGHEVRWQKKRARLFHAGQNEEAQCFYLQKCHEIIKYSLGKYIRDNAYWLMVHHSDGFD